MASSIGSYYSPSPLQPVSPSMNGFGAYYSPSPLSPIPKAVGAADPGNSVLPTLVALGFLGLAVFFAMSGRKLA